MKTIQEAAKEYVSKFSDKKAERDLPILNSMIKQSREKAFKAGAEYVQRWIPVEEELPPSEEVVLCKYTFECEDAYTAAAYYAEHKMWITPMHLCNPDIEYKPEFWRPIEIE